MDNKPVSVVIPSYGRDVDIVSRAVESALAQDYSPIEVLLVDDNIIGDERCAALEAYCLKYDNVTYVKTAGKQGACAARNLGFEKSKGAYIGFLDDDDEWMPEKVSASIPLFTEGVGMVGSRGYQVTIDKDGRHVEPYMPVKWIPEPTFIDLLRFDSVGTTTLAIIERGCFEAVGGFEEELPARQDYEMWLRISKKYRIVLSERFLFNHYIYDGEQISKNHQRALDGLKFIYNEFYEDYKKDKQSYAFIWALMLKRYRALGDKKGERKALWNVVKAQPRYLGRYIAETTKNERLSSWLKKKMRND